MTNCPHCNEDFDRLDRHEPHCKQRPAAEVQSDHLFPVKLLKNYCPQGEFEIVGEEPVPVYPGAVTQILDKGKPIGPRKLWKGTVVRLPRDEARNCMDNTREWTEIVGETKQRVPRIAKDPIAERADALPV